MFAYVCLGDLNRFNFTKYFKYSADGGRIFTDDLGSYDRIIVQLESLGNAVKIGGGINYSKPYSLIVMDEVESLRMHFNSSTMGKLS